MRWAGPVSQAGSFWRDDCSAWYYIHEATEPACSYIKLSCEEIAMSKKINQVILFSLILYFSVLFSVVYGLINIYVL